jgi:kumamolisin
VQQLPGTANAAAMNSAAVNPAAAQIKPFAGNPQLASFTWGERAREKMSYVKPVTIGAMEVDVLVKMRDPGGLVKYAQSASNPKSANYRHFLSPQDIADRYGASPTDYKTAADYFKKLGMRVGMWPQRETLAVTGTLKQLTAAFGTNFGYFRYGREVVVAPMQTPHFSRAIPVTAVLHLSSYNPAHRYYLRGVYSHFAGYSPQMLASGFDYAGAYAEGYTGAGINAGINGTGPISPADVPGLGALWHANVGKVTQVNASPQPAAPVNGNTGTGSVDPYPAGLAVAPPVTAPNCTPPPFPTPPDYNKCNTEDYEAQLDSEQVASLAPGATTLFYMAYNPGICVSPTTGNFVNNNKNGSCPKGSEKYPLIGIQLSDDSLQQAIADNRSDTQSLSWGEPENEALAYDYISNDPSKPGVGQIEFASFAAEGIAVFVSSGDDGAWECFDPATGAPLGIACVSYPASDPNVTSVGGVNIPLSDAGILQGQITAWADNTTAGGNGEFRNNVGSGGGVSAVFPAPPWQAGAVLNANREVPDISLDADPNTGPSQMNYAGFKGYTQVFADGGTSAAAPEANAEWALVLQACMQTASCSTATGPKPYRLGNAAPLYYALYQNKTTYASTFYDVVYGNNQAVPAPTPTPPAGSTPAPLPTPVGYSAGKGYDMVTGVGVPFGGHLINAVLNYTAGSKSAKK